MAQSTSLKVLTKAAVSEVLRLMQKPATNEVPFALAREVASREGAKAVLDGDISQIGNTYVIAARLVGALDGAELAQFRRVAKSQNDLVEVLGLLSKDIRSKVGESLRNVHESIPLERVTTASLPALKKYVEGVQVIASTGDNARGRVLLEEAVALDSTFAMAWRRIAASYSGVFAQSGASQLAITKAFRYRDRLSENERLLTEAYYYSHGPAPDRERTIAAYESLIERDSTNRSALNNVAIEYANKRDFARAEERLRRSVAVQAPFGGSYGSLVLAQLNQNKVAAAESTFLAFEKRFPQHGDLLATKALIAFARGTTAAGDSLLRTALATVRSADSRAMAATALAASATMRGRLRDGQRILAQSIPDPNGATAGAVNVARLSVMLDSAWVQSYYLNDAAAAGATVRRALGKVPMESIAPQDRPWGTLLAIAAVTHDGAAARGYESAYEKDGANSTASLIAGTNEVAKGFLALAENRPADAAARFAAADKGDLGPAQIGPWRAKALDLANQPDSAITEFERYLALPDPGISTGRDNLAGTHKRLGELYDAKGNSVKALAHYEKFVELWKDADPELQPKVRAARARIDELRRKGVKG